MTPTPDAPQPLAKDAGAPLPPPRIGRNAAPPPDARFLMLGDGAGLWYEPSPKPTAASARELIISFDNLATIDEGWPRNPWAMHRLAPLGTAILGVQSAAKDWFRRPAAPDMLRALTASGFFGGFDSIVMVGASMGAFAALNFAPLVPRARVIALSPQTSMNKTIAPFEARFPFAVRKSNWDTPEFLDAATAIPHIPAVALLYDPFTPEDAQHAARLRAPNVQCLRLDHATHEAVRVVMKSGAFAQLVQDMLRLGQIGPQFWALYRARKSVPKWQKALLQQALARGHYRGALGAGEQILAQAKALGLPEDELAFARRACREARQRLGLGLGLGQAAAL